MGEMIPHDRRCSTRFDASHLIVHAEPGERETHRALGLAVTLDISEFGARVQATEAPDAGQCFRFSLALEDDIVNALGKVVYVSRALNGTFEYGVEFLEIGARDIERLRRRLQQEP